VAAAAVKRDIPPRLALPLAAFLAACNARSEPVAPAPRPVPVASASASASTEPAAVPAASAVAPPSVSLADDLAARTAAARSVFGPHARTRVVGDVYLLAGPPALGGLFDQTAALVERALRPLFRGRFSRRPDAAITVLLFASKRSYDDYVALHYGPLGANKYGVYHPATREIVADESEGPELVPTVTHEIVHPIIEADFPHAPLWFNEAVASVFEAPEFPPDGGIRGTKRNWRHPQLTATLRSKSGREKVHLGALFGMGGVKFLAWSPDAGVDLGENLLHCAMARAFAVWLDEQGKLWPFYQAWRDGFAADPTGRKAFLSVMGVTPEAADAAWLAWVN